MQDAGGSTNIAPLQDAGGSTEMNVRYLNVVAVLVISLLCWSIMDLQPRLGAVTGIAVDSTTGKPVRHAHIWLNRTGDNEDSSAANTDNSDNTSQTADDLGSTDAPYGWNQGFKDDTAGETKNKQPADELETHTDGAGRFIITGVPAGNYNASASASGYDEYDSPNSFSVAGDASTSIGASLSPSSPTLTFSLTAGCWMPGEDAVVGLTGNVANPNVTLKLFRADVNDLLKNTPSVLLSSGQSGDGDSDSAASKLTLVRTWSADLSDTDDSGDFYQSIDMGKLAAGFYQIQASAGETTASGWICVTRLALIRKTYHGNVLAYVADISTGTPQPKVPISLLELDHARATPLAEGVTDANGMATLSFKGAQPESSGIIIARNGDSTAAVALELNSPGEAAGEESETSQDPAAAYSAGALRSFIYTDRPIYRPGQTIYFKGIDRFFIPHKADLAVPKNLPVVVDIKDAQNNLISHQTLKTDDMGSWNGSVTMSTEALTGEYSINTTVADQQSQGTFTVAAYHKPEFKVTIDFDRARYVRGDTITATVSASYYFGSPVVAGKLRYFASSDDSQTAASSAQPYNPNLMDSTQTQPSGESDANGTIRLDDQGKAVITVPTKVDHNASEDEVITFDADVTDPSNRDVDQNSSVTVGQGEFSLNVEATPFVVNPGSNVSLKVTASNVGGAGLSNQNVDIVTAYEAWSKDEERLTGITKKTMTTDSNGEIALNAIPSHGGLFDVKATSTDSRGNVITSEMTVWVQTGAADLPIQYPNMAVLLDKPKYKVGDTAHVLINTDHTGTTALVTIEGSTLYRSFLVPLPRRSTAFDLPVIGDYSPGVTVSVCAISDKQYLSSTQELTIDDTRRKLKITINSNRTVYGPGDQAAIIVTTSDVDGRPQPAELSLGVVDSSIYAIQEDSAGSIDDVMLPDQGDVVDTAFSCPQVYLGDVDKGSVDIKLRKNLKDTAYWNPVVRTGADGKAAVNFPLPDNLTTWRVTCVGHTASTAVGKSTCNLVVTKDMVARLETPNFLVAGDTATITGVVNNNTSRPFEAKVSLNAANLTISSALTQSVSVPAGRGANVTWKVSSKIVGDVDLQMRAWTNNGINDGLEQQLNVEPHASRSDICQAGSALSQVDRTVTLDPDALPASSSLRIRITPSVSSALVPAWTYLAQYPYGGTDSTASILIGDSIFAANTAAISPDSAVTKSLKDEIVRSELRLARFQNDDGGWSWFPGGQSDMWMTTQATWSLLLARDAGFEPNPTVLKAALHRTAATAQIWMKKPRYDYASPSSLCLAALVLAQGGDNASAQAILNYVQARRSHGLKSDQSDLSDSSDTYNSTTDLAVCILAAHKIGGPYSAKASQWMNELWSYRTRLGELSAWTYTPHQQSMGARARASQDLPDDDATAWSVLAAEAVNPGDARIDGVTRWLMENRTDDHWQCPTTTAVTLMALGSYLAASHERQPNFTTTITVNGRAVKTLHFDAQSLVEPDITVDVPGSQLAAPGQATDVRFTKSGHGRLYYAMDLQESKPASAPVPTMGVLQRWYDRVLYPEHLEEPFQPSGYRIKRVYLRNTTRRNFFWEDTVPTRSTDYQPNDDVIVRLIIDSNRPGSHLIVEEPVPAGCTISELSTDSADDWTNWWDYTDVRDDKIIFYIRSLARGRNEIDYHLHADAPGSYDVMPPSITSTFDPTLHVLGSVNRITVQ